MKHRYRFCWYLALSMLFLTPLPGMAKTGPVDLPEVFVTRAVLAPEGPRPVMPTRPGAMDPHGYAIVFGSFTEAKTEPAESPFFLPEADFIHFTGELAVQRATTPALMQVEALTIRLDEEARFPAPSADAGNHYLLFGRLLSTGGAPMDKNTAENTMLLLGPSGLPRVKEMAEAPTAPYWLAVQDKAAADEALLTPPWSHYREGIDELSHSVWLTPMPDRHAPLNITLSPESKKPFVPGACVVSAAFAEANGLTIGSAFSVTPKETVTLNHVYSPDRDETTYDAYDPVPAMLKAMQAGENAPKSKPQTLTVVGIYTAPEGMPTGHTQANTIYIPNIGK